MQPRYRVNVVFVTMRTVVGKFDHQGIRVTETTRVWFFFTRTRERLIPYADIVAAKDSGTCVVLGYVRQSGDSRQANRTGKLEMIRVRFTDPESTQLDQPFDAYIIAQAYQGVKRDKSLFVFINPHGGTGNARDNFFRHARPVFEAAGTKLEIMATTHHGHAAEVVKTLDLDKYDGIVCVSGDGLPHEVLNGLAARPEGAQALRKMPVAQLAGGSGNALVQTLMGTHDLAIGVLGILKGRTIPLDLMAITQGQTKFYSFLSQSFGIIADCDLGTDDWRWMGPVRFDIGIAVKTWFRQRYPCELAYKLACGPSKEDVQNFVSQHGSPSQVTEQIEPSLELKYGTVNDPVPEDWQKENRQKLSLFYVGNMSWMAGDAPVFPHALPQDGAMDMISWDTSLGRWNMSKLFLKFGSAKHAESPDVNYRKVSAFRLSPANNKEFLSVDGEPYPCEPFQVEVLKGAASIISPNGEYFPTP